MRSGPVYTQKWSSKEQSKLNLTSFVSTVDAIQADIIFSTLNQTRYKSVLRDVIQIMWTEHCIANGDILLV